MRKLQLLSKDKEKSQKKIRVLLVEDHDDLKYIMKTILEMQNFEVVTTSNGKAALSLYNDSFDIILTDIIMPEMGGIELISKVRKINPNVRCLAITGFSDISDPKNVPLIHKPVSSSRLVTFVNNAIK